MSDTRRIGTIELATDVLLALARLREQGKLQYPELDPLTWGKPCRVAVDFELKVITFAFADSFADPNQPPDVLLTVSMDTRNRATVGRVDAQIPPPADAGSH